MLPGVLFVVLFVVTSNLNLTIGVSAALAVLQVVIRLVQRQSVMGALSGLIAVGICLIWAWQSHEARNYYMFGFLTNAAYIVLCCPSPYSSACPVWGSWSSSSVPSPPSISARGCTAG